MLAFDGEAFHGWQYQPSLRTVEGVLRKAVTSMVQHEIKLATSSRTDRGVHSLGLPVSFSTTKDISSYSFLRGLNSLLPDDVRVVAVDDMPDTWRVREAAAAKTYLYRYQFGVAACPLWRRTSHFVKRLTLDVEAMNRAAHHFEGIHDFQGFRFSRCQAKQTTREMYEVRMLPAEHLQIATLSVTGSGFLHNMVRIVAGTILDVGIGRRNSDTIPDLIIQRDRTLSGPTLPAKGLTLEKVHFDGYRNYPMRGPADAS